MSLVLFGLAGYGQVNTRMVPAGNSNVDSSQCIEVFESIYPESYPVGSRHALYEEVKRIDTILKKLKASRFKVYVDVVQLNILERKWDRYKVAFAELYDIDSLVRINADIERMQAVINSFRADASNSRDLIFRDFYIHKQIASIKTASKDSNYAGIPFFIKMDSVADSTVRLLHWSHEQTKKAFIASDSLATTYHEKDSTAIAGFKTLAINNQDSIKYYSFLRDTSIHFVLTGAFMGDGLYGLGGSFILKSAHSKFYCWVLGGEVLFPIDSRAFQHGGLGIHTGVQYRSLLYQAGVVYLRNERQSQNVSWKTGLLVHPPQCPLLFGATYSPVSGFGILVGYKF